MALQTTSEKWIKIVNSQVSQMSIVSNKSLPYDNRTEPRRSEDMINQWTLI